MGQNLQVLPGMEVNFRLEPPLGFARIHLVTILPEGSTVEAFARLFHGQSHIPDDAKRNGNEEVSGISLKDWIGRVHGEGGICMAAHVENAQGIRLNFRQVAREALLLFSENTQGAVERENGVPDNLQRFLLDSGVDAVEIHKTDDVKHYVWAPEHGGQKRWLPTILTFDAHNVEEFCRPERITHLKMTHVGLTGLRDAFRFPNTRIRFHDSIPVSPNPKLLGIQIKGEGGSFFQDATLASWTS